jgi:hypothetical protein
VIDRLDEQEFDLAVGGAGQAIASGGFGIGHG